MSHEAEGDTTAKREIESNPILSLFMEAHDDKLNIHRFYSIHVGETLFGLAIDIVYGRKELFRPSRGKQKTYMVDSLIEAQQKVAKILKKRFSAPRRRGKTLRPPYIIIHAHSQANQLPLSEWMPSSGSTPECFSKRRTINLTR